MGDVRTPAQRLADPDVEADYLGAAIMDPAVLDSHPVDATVFVVPRNRLLYETMRDLNEEGALDPVSLRARLLDRGAFVKVGGDEGLVGLTARMPTLAFVPRMRERLEDLRRDRSYREALAHALIEVENGQSADAILELENKLDALRKRSGDRYSTTQVEAERAYAASAKLRAEGGLGTIPTGVPLIDDDAGGVEPGDLVVIGGDTSVGKSSVALMMATHQAACGEVPGIVVGEDPPARWGKRALALTANVPIKMIARACWSDAQGETMRFRLDQKRRAGADVHLAYAIGERLDVMVEAVRYLLREKRCTVVYLDYISAFEVPGVDDPSEQVRLVTQRFKREFSRPGIRAAGFALSQFRKREDEHERPARRHLYFGQRLAQSAELIALLWKDKDHTLNLVLDKSKDSGTGDECTLERDRDTGMLVDPARSEEHRRQAAFPTEGDRG